MKKKLIKSVLFSILCMSLSVPPAFALDKGGSETAAVSLEELMKAALDKNPGIKSARYRWESAIETIPQAGSLPDPMFSYTYFPEPIETKLGPNTSRFMISQSVPYPEKLKVKEQIAASDVRASAIEYRSRARDVLTELGESFFELLYIQKALEITRQNRDIIEALAKIGAADYAADSTSLNDVLTAQSQLAQLNYDFLLLKELKETETAKINSLLDNPPDTEIGALKDVAAQLPYTLDELYDAAAKNQEEIRIIEAGIEKMNGAEKLARLSSYPDFKVELVYSQIGDPTGTQPQDAGRDSYGVTVGVSLPIWSARNEAAVREKTLKKKEMIEMKSSRINMTNAMIKNLYFRMTNAQRLVDLYAGTLIPQAETTMEKSEMWYKQKQGSFAQLLETQSVWLNFNLAYHRAAADRNKMAVRLQNLIGLDMVVEPAGNGGVEK